VYLVLEYDKTQIILEATSGTVDNPVWDRTSSFDVSRLEKLSIQIYTRVPISSSSQAAAINSYSEQANSPFIDSTPMSGSRVSPRSHKKYEDVFLGSCKISADSAASSICNGWLPLS